MHFNCSRQEYKVGGHLTDMLKNTVEKGGHVGVYPELMMTKE